MAVIAEAFHVLPSTVARDLDDDPEQISLLCLPLLSYARAKHAFDVAKDQKDLEPWAKSMDMALVRRNKAALDEQRKVAAKAAATKAGTA